MPLISVAELRQLVTTALDDIEVAAIIEREEADLDAKLGPAGDGATEITEIVEAAHGRDLFVSRPIVSVTTINGLGISSGMTVLPRQGRITGGLWSGIVTVVYVPADDLARRKQGLIDLVRLTLERTAMQSENVAGEYQYAAPNWAEARAAVLRRLMYTSV